MIEVREKRHDGRFVLFLVLFFRILCTSNENHIEIILTSSYLKSRQGNIDQYLVNSVVILDVV